MQINIEKMLIVVQDLSKVSVSIEEYTKSTLNQLEEVINGFNIIKGPDESLLDGRKAKEIRFNGIQGDYYLHYIQAWCLANNNAYMITCAAESRGFLEKLNIFEEIIKSFRLNKSVD